ncbi:hypothetical protein B0G76_1593 [Paraburkholderia sp. BL23I1N1]|uniref:hypothetical protein n=1 Tax=Paraburkholderia sp. BL23I1N1 TaxID=1938802 RepID=UPI000FF0C9B0|nr:hypothetical protein [Paraburkholderia sp. BL23I1N1]RKE35503.1 hypothetical protein B0G76_1593 [Paraburkholderia sp. BL23I1N1]
MRYPFYSKNLHQTVYLHQSLRHRAVLLQIRGDVGGRERLIARRLHADGLHASQLQYFQYLLAINSVDADERPIRRTDEGSQRSLHTVGTAALDWDDRMCVIPVDQLDHQFTHRSRDVFEAPVARAHIELHLCRHFVAQGERAWCH